MNEGLCWYSPVYGARLFPETSVDVCAQSHVQTVVVSMARMHHIALHKEVLEVFEPGQAVEESSPF